MQPVNMNFLEEFELINSFIAIRFQYPVDTFFLSDAFNRTNIDEILNITPNRLKMLMHFIINDEMPFGYDYNKLNKDAIEVYCILHARFLLTESGLLQVRKLYESGKYGKCPRTACEGQHVLPIDAQLPPPQKNHAQIYCPKCEEIYRIGKKEKLPVSGAFFGTDLPHMFFMQFPELRPRRSVNKAKCGTV